MTPQQLSQLFAAERGVRSPAGPPSVGLSRLLAAHAANAAALPVAIGSLKVGTSLFSKWLLLGFVVGVAGAGAAAHAWSEPASVPPPTVLAAAPPPLDAPTPSSAAEPGPSPAETEPAPLPPAAAAPRDARPPASAASSNEATLDQELRLISAAKQEIDQSRPHLGLVLLEQHRQRFPGVVLSLDREALSISARCAQRKQPALARDFAARHPGAPMIAQLFKRCGEATGNFSDPTNAEVAPGERKGQ